MGRKDLQVGSMILASEKGYNNSHVYAAISEFFRACEKKKMPKMHLAFGRNIAEMRWVSGCRYDQNDKGIAYMQKVFVPRR